MLHYRAEEPPVRVNQPEVLVPQEETLYLNCQELLSATLAVQTFAKKKLSISILLRINNMTAAAYINSKGGAVSPNISHMAKTMVEVHEEKNLTGSSALTGSHQPYCRQRKQNLA